MIMYAYMIDAQLGYIPHITRFQVTSRYLGIPKYMMFEIMEIDKTTSMK